MKQTCLHIDPARGEVHRVIVRKPSIWRRLFK